MSNKILDDLIACRVPSDTILAVARLIADAELTQDRRQRDVDRKRSSRARVRGRPRKSLDVTGPPPVDTTPPKKKDSKRNLSMPIDFALTDSDIRFATDKGFDEPRIKLEYQRFCDHATANGRRQADWHAAWRTWVTSPYQSVNRGPNSNGTVNGRHVETPKRRTVLDVAREFSAHLKSQREFDLESGEGRTDIDLDREPDGSVPKG